MNEFFEKITSKEIDAEVGGVVLFGVFKPADAPQRWDVIVSADWVRGDNTPGIYYTAHKLQERLTVDELVSLSYVEALPPSSDFVTSVLDSVRVTGEGVKIEYRPFNRILMAEAYIAIANPDSHSHSPLPASYTQRGRRGRKQTNSEDEPAGRNGHEGSEAIVPGQPQ